MREIIDNLFWGALAIMCLMDSRRFFREGRIRQGKITRALGPFGGIAVNGALAAMLFTAFVQNPHHPGQTLVGRAGAAFTLIILCDDYFNGGDPPQRKRRRAKAKKMFARFAPAKAG